MRLFIALVVVATALAGCSDSATPSACEIEADDGSCVEGTNSTGVVRGVVVDQAIVPLAGVRLAFMQGQAVVAEQVSDEQGSFVFPALEDGAYLLRAEKPGYASVEVPIRVEAGSISDIIRVQLNAIPGFNAFYNQFQWDGYIQCNTTNANLCLIINYYPNFLLGTGSLTNDASWHMFYEEFVDVGRHPDWTQIETAWESTQPTGERLSIRYQGDRPDTVLIDCPYGAGGTQESASPQIFTINRTKAEDLGLGKALAEDPDPDDNCDPTEANGLGMEFFSGDALGVCQSTPIGCHPRVGTTLEQRTQTFVTAFYDYTPPEDWSFVATSDVPQPPQ